MRKITRLAVDAFMSDTPFRLSNTGVLVYKSYTELRLHGHTIAAKFHGSGDIYIRNTGFQTNVIKERLNGIPGVHIVQKNFQWFLNGVPWDGDVVKVGG